MSSINTLYLTRNGLLEPLGQSQVLSYMRGLSRDYRITLITFEKSEDWADQSAVDHARGTCETLGIEWHPQRFLRHPPLLAPAWGQLVALVVALRLLRSRNIKLIHARSYLPAGVAWVLWKLTGVPFIFDMRALWPEELITAGRLRRDSLVHRFLGNLERICLRDAASIVSLTNAAVGYLEDRYPKELSGKRVAVIPTCADLERFKPPCEPPNGNVYGCLGTVLSGWFKPDWLSAFFRAVERCDPDASFELITRDDPDRVRATVDPKKKLCDFSIFAAPPDRVPELITGHAVSAMFFAEGTSKLGSAPTRLGEVLGCGIPVVANEGVGDVAEIIRHYRVGVIAHDASDQAMDYTVTELMKLRSDPDLATRCRQAAEEMFSLERGTEKYRLVYKRILFPHQA